MLFGTRHDRSGGCLRRNVCSEPKQLCAEQLTELREDLTQTVSRVGKPRFRCSSVERSWSGLGVLTISAISSSCSALVPAGSRCSTARPPVNGLDIAGTVLSVSCDDLMPFTSQLGCVW